MNAHLLLTVPGKNLDYAVQYCETENIRFVYVSGDDSARKILKNN